jgi:hypothetical protein
MRTNARLCHCFCGAFYDGTIFWTTQHALNVQLKLNVSRRKCANGIRSHFARTRFNKPFGDASAVNVIGYRFQQIIIHPDEIGYGREWKAQFATKASDSVKGRVGSHSFGYVSY